MNATTSLLTNAVSLGSGAQGTMAYTGSSTQPGIAGVVVNDADILPPNTYLTWGFQGTLGYASDKLIGSCKAEFLVN
jgi:hypothetical protein